MRPEEYFPKKLEVGASEEVLCLEKSAGKALPAEKASNLTWGQLLEVFIPYQVKVVL